MNVYAKLFRPHPSWPKVKMTTTQKHLAKILQEKAKNSYRRLMLLKTHTLDDRFKLAFFFFTDAIQANNGVYFAKMKDFKRRTFQFNMSWHVYNEPV